MDDRELDQRLNLIEQKQDLILFQVGYKYDDEKGFYLEDEEADSDE